MCILAGYEHPFKILGSASVKNWKIGGTFHQDCMGPGPQRVAVFLGVMTPECLHKQLQLAKHNH